MNLLDAVRRARVDWEEGLEDLAHADEYAIAQSIRNSIRLPDGPNDHGPWVLIDYGDDLTEAYRTVLRATDQEVEGLRKQTEKS